jgi:hypothetical protein
MKVGDLVKVRLPHSQEAQTALLVEKTILSLSGVETRNGPSVWWKVLIHGKLQDVHQDFVKEIIR